MAFSLLPHVQSLEGLHIYLLRLTSSQQGRGQAVARPRKVDLHGFKLAPVLYRS